MTAVSALAGVSCGGKGTSRFEQQQDLSLFRSFFVELLTDAAGYEMFSPVRPFDLANTTIRYTGTLNYNDRWAGNNNTAATARRIALPFDSSSALRYTEIEKPGDVDFFKFRAKAGQIVVAEVLTGSWTRCSACSTRPARCWRSTTTTAPALSRLAFVAPADGDYVVGVTTYPDFDVRGSGPGDRPLRAQRSGARGDAAAARRRRERGRQFGVPVQVPGNDVHERLRQRQRQPHVRRRRRRLQSHRR